MKRNIFSKKCRHIILYIYMERRKWNEGYGMKEIDLTTHLGGTDNKFVDYRMNNDTENL